MSSDGNITNFSVPFVPYSPLVLSFQGDYYKSSPRRVLVFLHNLCLQEISDHYHPYDTEETPAGVKLGSVKEIQSGTVNISSIYCLISRMLHCLFDCVSATKRVAIDLFLETMGYYCLISIFTNPSRNIQRICTQ